MNRVMLPEIASRRAEIIDAPEPEMMDFSRVLVTLLRRKGLILGCVLACAVLGLAASILAPRAYSTSALVMLLPEKDRISAGESGAAEASPDSTLIESEVAVLRSRTLAARVVDELNLTANSAPLLPASPVADAIASIKRIFAGKNSAASQEARREGLIDDVLRSTSVKRRTGSYAIDVSASAARPADAALIANTLSDLYLEWQLETRFERAGRTNAWLADRLKTLQLEVDAKEKAVEAYRATSGLLSTGGDSTLTEQQMNEVQRAVLQANTEFAEKSARLAQVEQLIASGGSAETIGAALNSSVIGELRARETDAARRVSEMEARYGDLHPELSKARAEHLKIESQIKAEISRIQANLKNEVDVARTRLATLRGSLSSVRGQLVSDNSSMIRQRELERDAAATRSVYESYLKRFQEISDEASLKTLDAQIVARAPVPRTPAGPGAAMMVGLWAALGLILGVGLAFGADALADRLNGAEEVEQRIGVATIASIPALGKAAYSRLDPWDKNPAAYIVQNPSSAFAEAFRVLRSTIRRRVDDSKSLVVAITSALPNEGKTTTALCLARISALAGQRVLLVDCDVRRRSLTHMFDIEPAAGIIEVLSARQDWREAVVPDTSTTAHLLPASGGATALDVFGGEAMAALLHKARDHYDLIVLDCPPVLMLADGGQLAGQADATMLVVNVDRAPARAVRHAVRRIEAAGGAIMGVALNQMNPRAPGGFLYGDYTYYAAAHKQYFAA